MTVLEHVVNFRENMKMIYINSNDDDDGNVENRDKEDEEEEGKNLEPQVVNLLKRNKMLLITGCLFGCCALLVAIIGFIM